MVVDPFSLFLATAIGIVFYCMLQVIGLSHDIRQLDHLRRRLALWHDGIRCSCGNPKPDKLAEEVGGGNPFVYCKRCDAFYYDEAKATSFKTGVK